MNIQWHIKTFDKLSKVELYNILKLRIETFIVEQRCAYQDLDDMDQSAWHLFATINENIIAYSRLQIKSSAVIRRVIVQRNYRKQGLGKKLMFEALKYIYSVKNTLPIELSAQFHLKKFYEDFGFNTMGEPYLDTEILHIKMIKYHDK